MRLLRRLAVLALALALPAAAEAGTVTTTIHVSVTIAPSCTVVATPLAFGTYDFTRPDSATATITLSCLADMTVSVGLDAGLTGAAAPGTTRSMANGTGRLGYEIYQDSGHTTVWGATGAAAERVVTSNVPTNLTAFGLIPAGQTSPAGSYRDTVIVSVNF
jgi:spore coat protein U-like protein